MAEITLSNTPRLSEISSVESPRNSFDQPLAQSLNSSSQTPTMQGLSYELLCKKPSPRILDETRVRRSPDSDALVSSDDEPETHMLSYFPPQLKGLNNLSSRRPSYAAEFQNRSRTYSVLGGGALSPTTTHPTTPSGEATAWATTIPTSAGSSQPFKWGGSIWNSDSRKSPPKSINARSASLSGPSAPSPLFAGSEALLPSPTTISTNTTEFPIPIPLQPQLRNYRSMSFSVGQREIEDHTKARLSPPTMLGSRGLQHRPSRPSLLSEEHYAGQSSPLRSVFETEDDEYGGRDGTSQPGGDYTSQVPGRHRFMSIGYDSSRLRARSASTTTVPTVSLTTTNGSHFSGRENERVMPLEEESVLIEDDDDFDFQQQRRANGRSMSMMHSFADGQRLDILRRQPWQSVGGGFGGLSDSGVQSRRHSFAAFAASDVASDYDLTGVHDNTDLNISDSIGMGGNRGMLFYQYVYNFVLMAYPERYFEDSRVRQRQSLLTPQSSVVGPSPSTPPNQHHISPLQYSAPRITQQPSPPPPHRGLMGIHSHITPQQRSNQLLYLVSFKACRADVFYVQEGTGLRVRKGDLVIVEADRGTDLGTVIHENITWQQAKEYKEHYAKEHLTWLLMFATRRVTTATTGNTPAQSQFTPGTGNTQQSQIQLGQDGTASMELKPKMIKRLAQVHEIQTLRDKEANEAKAKRVCQQKVLEHRLPMEILDAEFQMYVFSAV